MRASPSGAAARRGARLLVLLAGFASPAAEEAPPFPDVLCFDAPRAFEDIVRMPHVAAANAEFNAWVKAVNETLAVDQREIQRLRREERALREGGRAEEASARGAEALAMERRFEEKFDRYGGEIAARRLTVRDAIEDQLLFLVHEVAEERGAALVFEKRSALLFRDEARDITGEVVRRYAERFDSLESPYVKGGVPRPLESMDLSLPVGDARRVIARDPAPEE